MRYARREHDCEPDADNDGPWRQPFIRGDESAAGEFKPIALGDAAATVIARLRLYREIGDSTDNPIEDLMGAALLMFFERGGHPLTLCKNLDLSNRPDGLLLVPQFKWSFYRSDWAIVNASKGMALLVECDGKDFHSSAAQRAHDSQKDEAALVRGYLTMRFTGSQINKDADGCAQKVFDVVFG